MEIFCPLENCVCVSLTDAKCLVHGFHHFDRLRLPARELKIPDTVLNLSTGLGTIVTPMNPGNPFLSFPQPVLPSTLPLEQPIHPPGTNPHAISGPYPVPPGGFQDQTQYAEDPNASSHIWVPKHAEPIRYDNVVNPVDGNSLVLASSYSLWSSTWTQQPLANDVTSNTPQQSSVSGQIAPGTLSTATSAELEKKRRKLLNGGTAVDSLRVCSVCNVVCNSQEVFHKHLAGKKHAAQAGLAALGDMAPYFAAIRSQISSSWSKVPKKVKFVQPAWCDVCKIHCNSSDVYVKHLTGKKHLKNLGQRNQLNNNPNAATSTGSSAAAAAATVPLIGPPEKPQANAGRSADTPQPLVQAAEKDLEMKRRKVVESGASAAAIRICTVCNVVCNSQTVFNTHLAGQKHADKVKKMTEAGKAAAAGR